MNSSITSENEELPKPSEQVSTITNVISTALLPLVNSTGCDAPGLRHCSFKLWKAILLFILAFLVVVSNIKVIFALARVVRVVGARPLELCLLALALDNLMHGTYFAVFGRHYLFDRWPDSQLEIIISGIVQTSYLQVYSLVMLAMNVDVYAAIKCPIWHRLEARNTLAIWTAILISMFIGSALFYVTLPLIFDYGHDKAGAVGGWIASASNIFIYYPTSLHVCFPNEYVRLWKLHLTVRSAIVIPGAGVAILTVLIVRELRRAHRMRPRVKMPNVSCSGTTSNGGSQSRSPPTNRVVTPAVSIAASGNGGGKETAVAVDAAALPTEGHSCRCRLKKCPSVRICALCRHAERLTLKLSAFMYARYLASYVLAEVVYRPLLLLDATDVRGPVVFALFLNGIGDGLIYTRFYRRLRQATTGGGGSGEVKSTHRLQSQGTCGGSSH